MGGRYPYQQLVKPGMVPSTPMFAASSPASVLNSQNLRHRLTLTDAVMIHPSRGTIHPVRRQHPLSPGKFTYPRRLGSLVTSDRTMEWQPVNRWMKPADNFGPFMASDIQPMGVRLMADGSFRAAEAFLERERNLADYGEDHTLQPSQAYVGAEIDVDNVVSHLRVIKLFPELIGKAPMEFHVPKGFRSVPAPWLDFRIAARDPFVQKNFRMAPLTEPERLHSHFYEAFVTCRKDRELISYPDESRLRATQWDPLVIDRETAAYSLAFKRNLACIQELYQIGNRVDRNGVATSSNTDTLSEISARSNGKSTNNPLKEFQAIVTRQFVDHRVKLTKWFMNPITFLHITQNDYVRSGGEYGRTPISIPYGGYIQMPTIPGVDIYVDARLPDDRIFMCTQRDLLWIGEGPKKVETIDERIRQQITVDFTDYYDAFCLHRDIGSMTERRYGCTVFLAAGDRVST